MATPDLPAGNAPPAAAARILARAERSPRHAVSLARRWLDALAEGHAHAPWARGALGWALLRWERVPEARRHIEEAGELALSAGDALLARHCACGLLLARQLAGEGASLQAAWEAFAERCAGQGAWGEVARARCEQVAHLNVLGRFAEARTLAAAAAPLVERHGSRGVRARHAHVAGVAAAGCGDLELGGELLARACAGFMALRAPVGVARVLFERAWVAQRAERFADARADLLRALAAFRRADLPLRVAFCQKDLGTTAGFVGDYPAAIAHALAARAQFAALGRDDLVARCDLNLGAVAHYSGLPAVALISYERAQATYASRGDTRLWAICQRNRALAASAQGQFDHALRLLDALDGPLEELGDTLEAAEVLAARGRALGQQGRYDAARAALDQARAQFLASHNAAAAAECSLDEAWQLLDQGRPADAAPLLQTTLAPLADRPAHLWRARFGLGLVAEGEGDADAALDHYEAACALVAGLRRQLATAHAASGVYAQARQLYRRALRLAADAGAPERLLALAEQQRALVAQRGLAAPTPGPDAEASRAAMETLAASGAPAARLDAAINAYIRDQLHARHAAAAAAPGPAPFDLGHLRAWLCGAFGREWTALAPVFTQGRLLLATVTPDDVALDATPDDPELAALLERACLPRNRLMTYRDLPFLRGRAAADWEPLRALAERLLPRTLLARLHPGHRLLIAPTGALHGLPWAALRLGDAWLCERAVVQLVPSLSRPAPLAPLAAADAPALLLGCADFGGRAPELPQALASLDVAAAHWPGPVLRAPANLTRSDLLALNEAGQIGRARLVHIASHAQGGGVLAHIKLADGDLLADEVLTLRLRGALVVLGMCEGSAGEVLPGDEVLSLGHAFLAAGAAGVLASLWPIYDASAMRMFELFYRALAEGRDPALALATAQRALAAHQASPGADDDITASPFVWASFGFTSVGVPCAA